MADHTTEITCAIPDALLATLFSYARDTGRTFPEVLVHSLSLGVRRLDDDIAASAPIETPGPLFTKPEPKTPAKKRGRPVVSTKKKPSVKVAKQPMPKVTAQPGPALVPTPPVEPKASGPKIRIADETSATLHINTDYRSYPMDQARAILRHALTVALRRPGGIPYTLKSLFTESSWNSLSTPMRTSLGQLMSNAVRFKGTNVRSSTMRIIRFPIEQPNGSSSLYATVGR